MLCNVAFFMWLATLLKSTLKQSELQLKTNPNLIPTNGQVNVIKDSQVNVTGSSQVNVVYVYVS